MMIFDLTSILFPLHILTTETFKILFDLIFMNFFKDHKKIFYMLILKFKNRY